MATTGYLHLISEDETDDIFYLGCLEAILGIPFQTIQFWRERKNGISGVRSMLHRFLSNIQQTGSVENTFFLVALDNDRCPLHYDDHQSPFFDPGLVTRLPKREQNKPCRFCEFQTRITEILGEQWPIGGVITVPTQMLESWLLLICNPDLYPDEDMLPIFSDQDAALAKRYFAPNPPPPQLKDLRKIEMARMEIQDTEEFCMECAEMLDPEDLASRSPSFACFLEQVRQWTIVTSV